jgi:hypothetical protein
MKLKKMPSFCIIEGTKLVPKYHLAETLGSACIGRVKNETWKGIAIGSGISFCMR